MGKGPKSEDSGIEGATMNGSRAPGDPAGKDDASGERWLSIDEASQMLGVGQAALRRWSDEGKVPVYRTPGGHRRYRETDLRAALRGGGSSGGNRASSQQQPPRRKMSHQVLTGLSFSGYQSDYLSEVQSRSWYRAYSPMQREELRLSGRRMVDLAVRSISGRGDHEQIIEEARAIGRRYGAISAAARLSTPDTVEAFVFFRSPVMQAVEQFIEAENLPAKRVVRIFAELVHFMDQVLIATIAAHADASG